MSNAEHPYLDTIETSCQAENLSVCSHINEFETSDDKKLYIAVDSLSYYKKLSENIAKCLVMGAGSDDFVFSDRAKKILNCGSLVTFNNSGTIISANFCRLRVCPMCQRRRALKVGAEMFRIIENIEGSWLHLVLTVPNVGFSELSDLLDRMYIASSRLFRYGAVKKAFNGVARFTEITYNSSTDTYHPHFHCLVSVDKSYFTSRKYIKVDFMRALWTVIMKSADNGIDIRRKSDSWIDNLIDSLDDEILYQIHMGRINDDNKCSAVSEIAKYSVKPLDIGLNGMALYEPLHNIFFALHGRRLVQTYGNIRDVARLLKIDLDSDAGDECGENILDRTNVRSYTWNRRESRYVALSL